MLIPLLGKDSFAPIALASKWVHNNISWAFMIGLIMVFFMWVLENKEQHRNLCLEARGKAVRSFDITKIASQYAELYRTLLEPKEC